MRSLHTIRLRLTLWGTGISLLVCLLALTVLYAGVRYSLYREVDAFLQEEIHEFYGVVREHHDDVKRAETEIRLHLGSRSRGDLRFRVLDETGSVLISSDSNDPVPPTRLIDRITRDAQTTACASLEPPGEPPVRVCSMLVTAPDGRRQIAQASYSLDRVNASLAVLRHVAGISMLLAALLAMGAGRLLASRSLAPLHQLTSTAERISGNRLSDRLPRSHNEDEFDRLAAVLNELLDRIEQYVKRMQQFAADASHELRSPLAALRGAAEVALSRWRTREEFRRVVEESIEHYDRLIRIAEDLLLLARLDAGEAVILKERIELRQAVEDVVDLFSPLAGERGILLTLVPGEAVSMVGDSGRLRQVLANLLDNAIKYTPAQGTVEVSLSRIGGCARLRVADSGVGISVEHLPRLFDRFYRVDRSRSRTGVNGVGLGLAICRSIVEAHAGTLRVESQPGKGTTVLLDLPVEVN